VYECDLVRVLTGFVPTHLSVNEQLGAQLPAAQSNIHSIGLRPIALRHFLPVYSPLTSFNYSTDRSTPAVTAREQLIPAASPRHKQKHPVKVCVLMSARTARGQFAEPACLFASVRQDVPPTQPWSVRSLSRRILLAEMKAMQVLGRLVALWLRGDDALCVTPTEPPT
jgi:hypothetical protein